MCRFTAPLGVLVRRRREKWRCRALKSLMGSATKIRRLVFERIRLSLVQLTEVMTRQGSFMLLDETWCLMIHCFGQDNEMQEGP